MKRTTTEVTQPTLPLFDELTEDPSFLTNQLITYIGNKRGMIDPIRSAIELAVSRLGDKKLRMLDMFSGSGVVSRLMKRYAATVIANDIENYARVISECYLSNQSSVDLGYLVSLVDKFNLEARKAPRHGFIEKLYAPADENDITTEDRVFYTKENARRLDTYRQLIETVPGTIRSLLLGPLLSEASIHANTAGVFKGFYKDRDTGIGKFGGSGRDALSRIKGKITLSVPVLSRFDRDAEIYQLDANELVEKVGDIDLAYFDPPYNQHPYGSNYFMLNLLTEYVEPSDISQVSGIPTNWTRSNYNIRAKSFPALADSIERVDARFVLLSFNDEGFISPGELRTFLENIGQVEEFQHVYATFRGCRNLRERNIHVTEHLYLIDKQR
jgi:adenine-specific DNA-methyltransferase